MLITRRSKARSCRRTRPSAGCLTQEAVVRAGVATHAVGTSAAHPGEPAPWVHASSESVKSPRFARTRVDAKDRGTRERLVQRPLAAKPQIRDCSLHVEADLQHIAVRDFVVLALDPQLADLLRLVPRSERQEFVPVDHLGPDETALHVAVDPPGASTPCSPSRRS